MLASLTHRKSHAKMKELILARAAIMADYNMNEKNEDIDETISLEKIDILLQKTEEIKGALQAMRLRVKVGERISAEELELAVEDINQLDTIMRPRRDVG